MAIERTVTLTLADLTSLQILVDEEYRRYPQDEEVKALRAKINAAHQSACQELVYGADPK
jgi:hypothetical protein